MDFESIQGLFSCKWKNSGRKRCAEREHKGHPGPQSGSRREAGTSDPKAREGYIAPQQELGIVLKSKLSYFISECVFREFK